MASVIHKILAAIAVFFGFVSGVDIGVGIVYHCCQRPSKFATTLFWMARLTPVSTLADREELVRHLRKFNDGWGEPFVVTFTGDKVVVASKHADDESLGSKRFCLRREFAIVPVPRPPHPQGD